MAQFDKHQLESLETTDQELFTDSFNFCCELLKSKEYYLSERETNIFSRLSLNYGQDMYDAMMIIINKIIKCNKHKTAIEKAKVESIKIVTTEATHDSGYDDNSDQLNQQQRQKQQVDKVHNQNKMISKKRKKSVDEIHSKKMFKADYKKNNSDDSSYAENIQIASSNENSIAKLHMIDSIEKEEELFMNESITIKDEMVSMTDDSIDVDEMNNSNDHSIGLVIENVDHQKNTRIRTESLAPKKYSFCTEKNDELSSTADGNDLDNNDIYVYDDDHFDDDDDNSLNQNENRENEIKVYDAISFEVKTRVVKLAREHPTWSLNMLKERSGCKNIRDWCQVKVWKRHIEQGGSYREKINCVNNWVIKKCIENQKKGEIITNEKIKTWALEAKKIFQPVNFLASDGWLSKLKKNHEVTGKPDNLNINCNFQKKKSFSYSRVYVPHEIKVKVVNLANKNPHWSLEMLRKQSGCNHLETINQLYNWKYTVNDFNKKRATGSKVSEKFNSSSVRYQDNDGDKDTSSRKDRFNRAQIWRLNTN